MDRPQGNIPYWNEELPKQLHMSAPAKQFEALMNIRELPQQFFLRFESGCDMACMFCRPKLLPVHYMDLDAVARFLDEASAFPVKEIVIIADEPLLHPNIIEIVALCRGAGFREICFTTSGCLLREPMIHGLAEAGLTSLAVPLYSSDPAIHDRIVGVAGAHKELVQNLEIIKGCKGVTIFIHSLAMRMNAPGLRVLHMEVYERFGFPFIVFPVRPKNMQLGSVAISYKELSLGYPDLIDAAWGVPLAGFPLCVAEKAGASSDEFWNLVAPSMKMYLVMQGYSKPFICNQCIKSESCFGTFNEHVEIFGETGLIPFKPESKS